MNRIVRMLAIAGMGVGAALAVAGPAQAANADAGHKAPVTAKAHWGDDDRVISIFDDPRTCNRVGRLGERSDRWDDYTCFRTRGGWALSVSENNWDDDWNGPFNVGGHHFGGGWGGFRHTRGFFH